MHLLRTSCLTVLGLASTVFSGSAFAVPTLYTLTAASPSLNVADLTAHVYDPALGASNGVNAYIGPLNIEVTPPGGALGQEWVYCTDIFAEFLTNKQYTLSGTDLKTSLKSKWGSSIGDTKFKQITNLLYGAANVLHFTPSTTPTLAQKQTGAAIQAALWEIQNEGGTTGYNVSNGTFYVSGGNSASFAGLANTYLTDALTNSSWLAPSGTTTMQYTPYDPTVNQSFGYIGLTGSGSIIPANEPPGMGILSVAFAGMVLVRLGIRPRGE